MERDSSLSGVSAETLRPGVTGVTEAELPATPSDSAAPVGVVSEIAEASGVTVAAAEPDGTELQRSEVSDEVTAATAGVQRERRCCRGATGEAMLQGCSGSGDVGRLCGTCVCLCCACCCVG